MLKILKKIVIEWQTKVELVSFKEKFNKTEFFFNKSNKVPSIVKEVSSYLRYSAVNHSD